MIASPLDLAYRQRRFWHFLRMRLRRRSDTVYRNYDLLAKWNEDSLLDLKWAGFRGMGESLKPALKRLSHNIWMKYDIRLTDIALETIIREFVVWERIHEGEVKNWPTRHSDDIKALTVENEAARDHPQPQP